MQDHLSRMLLSAIIFIVLLEGHRVSGGDANSILPRENCYPNEQPDCNEEFIVKYPEYSESVTGLSKADTWFLLFTRKNPEFPEKLHKCGGELPPGSNFNAENRLIVILTPYLTGMCDTAFQREWVAQFLIREDVNVLAVDYSWGNRPDVEEAIENSRIAGNQTVIVLKNIQKATGIVKEKIYLMGISLGAQMAGFIGHYFPVGRITGLDPAGPGFTLDVNPIYRLDRYDADFVDVWHTNGGQCIPYFGIDYDAGDVDFWINGGLVQFSCYPYAFISLLKGDLFYAIGSLVLPTLCFHVQSAQYYKVSINPGDCQFVGVKCNSFEEFKSGHYRSCGTTGDNCLIMGYDTDKYYKITDEPQRYYVRTSFLCPYCNKKYLSLGGFEGTYNSSLQTC